MAEIILAQRLAANDKIERERAVRKVRRYLQSRTSSKSSCFKEDDFLKLWKGLHYCMWMCDKPLVQEDLADRLASLVHVFSNPDQAMLFFDVFLATETREWYGMDRLRMDKFLMLFRRVLVQSLKYVRDHDWEEGLVSSYVEALRQRTLLSESCPIGLTLHVVDIFLESLSEVAEDGLTVEQTMTFLEPFCQLMATSKDQSVISYARKRVFDEIAYQAFEDEAEEQEGGPREEEDMSGDEEEDEDGEKEEAGIQFDCGVIADRLFELAGNPECRQRNRKVLYKLVQRYRVVCGGEDPYTQRIKDDRGPAISHRMVDAAVQRLSQFNAKLYSDSTRARRERKKQKKQKLSAAKETANASDDTADSNVDISESSDSVGGALEASTSTQAGKKRKRKRKANEGEAIEASNGLDVDESGDRLEEEQPPRKKKSKAAKLGEASGGKGKDKSGAKTPDAGGDGPAGKKVKGKKKNKVKSAEENGDVGESPAKETGKGNKSKKEEKSGKENSLVSNGGGLEEEVDIWVPNQKYNGPLKEAFAKEAQLAFEKTGNQAEEDGGSTEAASISAENSSGKKSKKKSKSVALENPFKNSFLQFDDSTTPNAAFFRTAAKKAGLVKSPADKPTTKKSKPETPPGIKATPASSRKKRVSFGIHMNAVQEFRKTEIMKASPVPSPVVVPQQGILKAMPTSGSRMKKRKSAVF